MDNNLQAELGTPIDQRIKPLQIDSWVASSLLQKAIRRGAEQVAQAAALTFFANRRSTIWRRLITIAFEDIGVASPQFVALTASVGTDQAFRRSLGEDLTVACNLSRILASATKSRAAEHLVTIAKYHVSLDSVRAAAVARSLAESVFAAVHEAVPVGERALALMCAWGLIGCKSTKVATCVQDLWAACSAAGVSEELVNAAVLATKKVRDPIIPAACLAWLIAKEKTTVLESATPQWLDIQGIPSYAFDKHTLLGRRAIRGLLKYSSSIRECLVSHADLARINEAAYMAAFYTDAAPLARRLTCQGGDELERMAIEADLMRVGVIRESVPAVLQVFSERLDHLNKLRAHFFFRERGFVDAATALLRHEEGTP